MGNLVLGDRPSSKLLPDFSRLECFVGEMKCLMRQLVFWSNIVTLEYIMSELNKALKIQNEGEEC